MSIHELRFVNQDATPQEVIIKVSLKSIKSVMAWYGAYYAGDTYEVFVDGTKVKKDHNGELQDPRFR